MHDFHVRWCACGAWFTGGEVLPILGRRLHHPFKRRGARLSGRFSTEPVGHLSRLLHLQQKRDILKKRGFHVFYVLEEKDVSIIKRFVAFIKCKIYSLQSLTRTVWNRDGIVSGKGPVVIAK